MPQSALSHVPFIRRPGYRLLADGPVRLGYTRNNSDLAVIRQDFPKPGIAELIQVHGSTIVPAEQTIVAPETEPTREGDGILAERPGLMPVIRTADCVPLFFWHRDRPCYGILHVGWRGLAGRIQRELLTLIRLTGLQLEDMRFLIGPAICARHYPVGPEVIAEFCAHFPVSEFSTPLADGKFSLDVKRGLRLDLMAQGVLAGQIRDCRVCTFEDAELPSYRRQKNGARIYNFITWL